MMSLVHARPLPDEPALPALIGSSPFSCASLEAWRGRKFLLPPGDTRLESIHEGGEAPSPPLDNLVGAVNYWENHPDWMEFMDPSSPSHLDKMLERALYLDRWERYLPEGCRVLDLGGGVGRFTNWLLDHGCKVELVDPDLRSLWRAVSMAGDRPGFIDVHWTTGECMPNLEPVDVVIASEVLCYVEDPVRVMDRIQKVLRPGGILLLSVEARWGWAMSTDVYEGTVEAFLTDGVVHVPGDRWVRTFTEDTIKEMLSEMEILELIPSHFAFSGPFENIVGRVGLETALSVEARLRDHPLAGQLNRAWMVVARRPGRLSS